MQTVVMHTMKKGHPMAAMVYWSKAKGEAYVSAAALPMPPKGMQYQVWVMQDGKPVDIGVLPTDMSGTPAMQKVNKPVMYGDAFAITLEKEGGSPTPTMENIYVMGKAS
jgi:anti-sigma-K factor RskA